MRIPSSVVEYFGPSKLMTRTEGAVVIGLWGLFALLGAWTLWQLQSVVTLLLVGGLVYYSLLYYSKVCWRCPQVHCPVNPRYRLFGPQE